MYIKGAGCCIVVDINRKEDVFFHGGCADEVLSHNPGHGVANWKLHLFGDIQIELAVPEVLELEVQEHEAAEVGLGVDHGVEIEAMATSQEAEEEDEAEVHAETTRKHTKLSINQTQRTAMVM